MRVNRFQSWFEDFPNVDQSNMGDTPSGLHAPDSSATALLHSPGDGRPGPVQNTESYITETRRCRQTARCTHQELNWRQQKVHMRQKTAAQQLVSQCHLVSASRIAGIATTFSGLTSFIRNHFSFVLKL